MVHATSGAAVRIAACRRPGALAFRTGHWSAPRAFTCTMRRTLASRAAGTRRSAVRRGRGRRPGRGLARGRMEHPDAQHRIHAGHQAPEGGGSNTSALDDLGGGRRQGAGGGRRRWEAPCDASGSGWLNGAAADKTTTSDDQDLRGYMLGLPMRMG